VNQTRRVSAAAVIALTGSLVLGACGSRPPTDPGPVNPPPPPPPNAAPVIESITVAGDRVEADAEIAVTATVRDAETPIEQLKFEWKADAGTFSGEGPAVKWRAPKDAPTPADYTLQLIVTETYASGTQTGQNVVGATSPSIRVHNSPKELGDLSLKFLNAFAMSSVPADVAVQDFSDSCDGKFDERDQIRDNRDWYEILSSSLSLKRVSVAASAMRGDITVACEFVSKVKKCPPNMVPCRVGDTQRVQGDCVLTGIYEQRRWWLCTSNFYGDLVPSMRAFFGRR
jgi:hypothetical protein